MISTFVAGMLGATIMLIGKAVLVRYWWKRTRYIPTPRGPLPVPTDEQLLAGREMHAKSYRHGDARDDGWRWCCDCGLWTSPDQWYYSTQQEGHKVTSEWVHGCPTED